MKISEHDHQANLFIWAQIHGSYYPELKYFHAIPNGAKLPFGKDKHGNRYSPQAKKLIDEGLKSGVPDTCLPMPRATYHGLYIELKSERGKPTPEQLDFVSFLNSRGYCACICYGFDHARAVLEWYLNLPKYGTIDQPLDPPDFVNRPLVDEKHLFDQF